MESFSASEARSLSRRTPLDDREVQAIYENILTAIREAASKGRFFAIYSVPNGLNGLRQILLRHKLEDDGYRIEFESSFTQINVWWN